jgi:hypothetical protein
LAEIKFSIMTRYEKWLADPSSVQPQAPASSTPSSLRHCAPLPYEQSPTEDDRARRERLDALLREDPRRREDVYPADGAREEHTRLRRMREEAMRRWVEMQRLRQQDSILSLQREADYAAQVGQNQGVTDQEMPVSSSVQYPSFSASAWDPFGPIAPLESPTRCVIFRGL